MNTKSKTFLSIMAGIVLAGTDSPAAQSMTQASNSPAATSPSAVSISGRLTELMQAVDFAETAYVKADGTNGARLWKVYVSLNATNVPKVLDLAGQCAASPIAFTACAWVVTNRQVQAGARRLIPCGLKSVELLRDRGYATNPALGPVCWALGRNWDCRHKPTLEFLQEVLARNPDREARGNAMFALARLMKEKSEVLGWLEVAPDYLSDEWRRTATEEAKTADSQMFRREAERLFESVIQTYSNCPVPVKRDSTLGEKAAAELYELQHVWRGQVAPEIEGEDLDGQKLKLSDYRGKVVLLSFWGTWCGPCMAMIPHERKLAEGMAGKPFAMVGVNSDVERLKARRAVEKEKVTWPSFWSGTNGNDGPIPTAWNVKGWPAIFVLDPQGTIRLKLEGFGGTNTDNLLHKTIDRLLKEYWEKGESSNTVRTTEPAGAANRDQPDGSETNRTSATPGLGG